MKLGEMARTSARMARVGQLSSRLLVVAVVCMAVAPTSDL